MGWIFYLVSICILPFVQLWLVQASIPLPWNMEDGELWMDHIMNTKLRWFSAVTLVTMDLVLLLLNAFLMGLGVGELKDRTAKVCLACFRSSFWGVNFLNYFFLKTQPLQWLEWLIFFLSVWVFLWDMLPSLPSESWALEYLDCKCESSKLVKQHH